MQVAPLGLAPAGGVTPAARARVFSWYGFVVAADARNALTTLSRGIQFRISKSRWFDARRIIHLVRRLSNQLGLGFKLSFITAEPLW
jgi:hypothetical protein